MLSRTFTSKYAHQIIETEPNMGRSIKIRCLLLLRLEYRVAFLLNAGRSPVFPNKKKAYADSTQLKAKSPKVSTMVARAFARKIRTSSADGRCARVSPIEQQAYPPIHDHR